MRGYKEEEIVVTSVNENTEETQAKPKGTLALNLYLFAGTGPVHSKNFQMALICYYVTCFSH